ncbi:hypothetical protein MMC18_006861 [Xylographa bjoerkii]|nr:hypothetical protein [Xylographa bjoerkii]
MPNYIPASSPTSKPFDRDAAEYIIKRFRNAEFICFIIHELYDMGYVLPSRDAVKVLLAANGMDEKDERVVGPHGFVAHEGKVWGEIVVPDEVLQMVQSGET